MSATTSFYDFEIMRLLECLTEYCHSIYNRDTPKLVKATIADWAYSMTINTIGFCYEDATMRQTIGTKVNRKGGNYGTGECAIAYGIIAHNVAAYTSAADCFKGLVEVNDENKARWAHLATLAQVVWFYADGRIAHTTWDKYEDLVEFEEVGDANHD
jgi:hypothetical protein